MGNSGVTFALWSWARAQAAGGHEVCVMHAPADRTGADVTFVSKDSMPGLTTQAVPHQRHSADDTAARGTRSPPGQATICSSCTKAG